MVQIAGNGPEPLILPQHAAGRGGGCCALTGGRRGGTRLPREGAPALKIHRTPSQDDIPDGQRWGK